MYIIGWHYYCNSFSRLKIKTHTLLTTYFIKIWDTNGTLLHISKICDKWHQKIVISDMVISPDDKFSFISKKNDNTIYILDLLTYKLSSHKFENVISIEMIILSPNNKMLAFNNRNSIVIVDSKSFNLIFTIDNYISFPIKKIFFSPDSKKIVVSSCDIKNSFAILDLDITKFTKKFRFSKTNELLNNDVIFIEND